jgi:hypothetical protein
VEAEAEYLDSFIFIFLFDELGIQRRQRVDE